MNEKTALDSAEHFASFGAANNEEMAQNAR
jgi:hypothetical protein